MPAFAYRRAADQDAAPGAPAHAVVIAGAGPVGLVLALDLASRGQRVVILDRRTALSEGSRAICWSKRTLEIMSRIGSRIGSRDGERHGLADRLAAQGVTWKTGKVFHRDAEVFAFDLLPEAGHQWPAFINLQQFHFESACIAAAAKSDLIDMRWGHELSGVSAHDDGVSLAIDTPDGRYTMSAGWLVAADGGRSTVRRQLGLGFVGQTFDDQFLICDIKMKTARPAERWFWFDPPFNPGRSALLHRQADDVWRLDFQIGRDADRDEEMKPDNVAKRVRAMLGDIAFSFAWISCYRFQCRRLEKFRHGRVLFAGDAAHQVSPFGARGGNSGIQDADNLGWKLAMVLQGRAPATLLDSYDSERRQAADENILNSTRSTDFIAPKGPGATLFRDAVLDLAAHQPFARRLLNSGRLSLPTTYDGSALNSDDGFAPGEAPALRPGAPAVDAPKDDGWLLGALGSDFTVLVCSRDNDVPMPGLRTDVGMPLTWRLAQSPEAVARYGATDQPAFYLIRPDQHIAARWRTCDPQLVADAFHRAIGKA